MSTVRALRLRAKPDGGVRVVERVEDVPPDQLTRLRAHKAELAPLLATFGEAEVYIRPATPVPPPPQVLPPPRPARWDDLDGWCRCVRAAGGPAPRARAGDAEDARPQPRARGGRSAVTNRAAALHRRLDAEHAEAEARDGRDHDRDGLDRPDICRRRIYRKDLLVTASTGLIKAAKLWMKTSQKTGKHYLTGRLGGVRILIFQNADRASDADPTHFLMLGEAEVTTSPPAALPQPRPERSGDAGRER